MSTPKKLILVLIPLTCFALLPNGMSAQEKGAKNQPVSVTGCLRAGSDKGGYFVIAPDGTMYELFGKGMKEHVSHQVAVTGKTATMSREDEAIRYENERSEAEGEPIYDVKVSSITMVSETCPAR